MQLNAMYSDHLNDVIYFYTYVENVLIFSLCSFCAGLYILSTFSVN